MTKIKIDHVISFSSEDPVHVASNILSNDTSKKWKCQTPGEKSVIVFLQLEKACLITGIDIGNEHSAYVEVLVSRSGMNSDYKVLLVTTSFMTPLEARQSQNINKVRMFTKENFSKPECDEKWDRIKVVCSQPFNKHVQYGLSFINLHTSDDKMAAPVQAHIGKFILRPESPDRLSAGSLFEKRKEVKEEKLTGAAAIREASSSASLAAHGSPVCKPKLITKNKTPTFKKESTNNSEKTSKPRNRNDLLYNKDEEEPNEKIDKIIEKTKETKEKDLEKTPKLKGKTDSAGNSSKKQKTDDVKKSSDSLDTSRHSKKKATSEKANQNDRKRKNKDEAGTKDQSKKIKKDANTKPFARLLEDVILVISGIQNPDRANLRTSALCMGAKYKSDWDATCTHLICAFPNTPKFNQVRGKGKIVKRSWIEDCYSQKKRLPWRRYALDKRDIGKDESEDEICAKTEPDSPVHEPVKTVESSDEEMDESDHKEEASDTEERVARIRASQKGKGKENEHLNSNNADIDKATHPEERTTKIQSLQKEKGKKHDNLNEIYDVDTDEDDVVEIHTEKSSVFNKLKNLFTGKIFYIDQTFHDDIYNKLRKYIVAYNGMSSDDPTGDVDFIVTKKENSETLKEINANALCLNPDWVWECHNSQKLVSVDQHIIY